jgi:hypothetical protein
MGWGDPRGAARCWPCSDDQADPAGQCDPGWVHHPRVPHRSHRGHGQVPGRPSGADRQVESGQLRSLVPGLPAPPGLHHRQAWAHHPHPPPRPRAACRAAPCGDPQLPAELPALAADGGTLDRLAGRRWLPAGALPWHRTQRPVVVGVRRRGQPTPPTGAWPCPPRWRLGAGLSSAVTRAQPGPDPGADRASDRPANRAP